MGHNLMYGNINLFFLIKLERFMTIVDGIKVKYALTIGAQALSQEQIIFMIRRTKMPLFFQLLMHV